MSKANKAKSARDVEDLSFEDAVAELEEIIQHIEQGEIGLEETLRQRKRGEALLRRCRAILDTAEQELKTVKVPPSADQAN